MSHDEPRDPVPNDTADRTADITRLSLDELIARTEAAYLAYRAPAPSAEATVTFLELSGELERRVIERVEDFAPTLFEALETGTPEEIAAAVATYRSMASVARRWLFAEHLDSIFRTDRYEDNDDLEPYAYLDAAIERRRALRGRHE